MFNFITTKETVRKKPQKLDIIQAVLQTLNKKYQNTKIGTTIYSI